MATQMITYDLRKPGQDYKDLYRTIKSLGAWWHCLESIWLVKTDFTSSQVREKLKPYIDSNDSILIAGLNSDWASYLNQECNDWLAQNMPH